MKRQFNKAIFLPANKRVLFDTENKGEVYVRRRKKVTDYPTKFHRSVKWKVTRKIWVDELKQGNEHCLHDSWELILKLLKENSFKVILYPNTKSSLSKYEIHKASSRLIEKGLVDEILVGNTLPVFQEAINRYNINPQHSLFIATYYSAIEEMAKQYFPKRNYETYKKGCDRIYGFQFEYWNTKFPKRETTVSVSMPCSIHLSVSKYATDSWFKYSNLYQPSLGNKIIYVEESFCQEINEYITQNIELIKSKANKKGFEFIYLHSSVNVGFDLNHFKDFLCYLYPQNVSVDCKSIENALNVVLKTSSMKAFLSAMNFTRFNSPSLIRNQSLGLSKNLFEYSVFKLDVKKDLNTQFDNYFSKVRIHDSNDNIFYQLVPKKSDVSKIETADDRFNLDARNLADDVKRKIDYLFGDGENALLAEIAVHMLKNFDDESLKQMGIEEEILTNIQLNERALSPLKICWESKYDFDIILPDYGNMIVEMPRLPKALYLFFVNHPEGVLFNELDQYRPELLSIYKRISNKSDIEEIERNIDRIIDPLDNSINVNCSRIKSAFVKLIDDRLAKNYYITGRRGEAKKINLSNDLISITD